MVDGTLAAGEGHGAALGLVPHEGIDAVGEVAGEITEDFKRGLAAGCPIPGTRDRRAGDRRCRLDERVDKSVRAPF